MISSFTRRFSLIALSALAFLAVVGLSSHGAGVASKFDYYSMELTWLPTACRSGNRVACKAIGASNSSLISVHGLWPTKFDNSDVSFCKDGRVINWEDEDLFNAYAHQYFLMQYEWDKHGTCSGLDIKRYFGRVRSLYQKLGFSDFYKRVPVGSDSGSSYDDAVKALGFNPESILLMCSRRAGKQYLDAIRVSFDRDFELISYPPSTVVRGAACSKKIPILIPGADSGS